VWLDSAPIIGSTSGCPQTDDVWISGEEGIYNECGCAFPSIDNSLGKFHEPPMATDLFLRGMQGQHLFPCSPL
jgi:hypothetical protein